MAVIHPTAIVDPGASLGNDVQIGAFSIVGPNTIIGDRTIIKSHVVIEPFTTLGADCEVWPNAVLGGNPQDLKFNPETESYVVIGDNVQIRESVTVHRATGAGEITKVGSNSMLMAYSHVGHNCNIGENVIIANSVQIGGHVDVGDYCFLGGSCVFHQFVRIGRFAMVGGLSASRQDIPPFSTTDGRPAALCGLNIVGLRRRNFTREQRLNLKKAYHMLWFMNLPMNEAIAMVRDQLLPDANVEELLSFVQTTKRGIHPPIRTSRGKTADGEPTASSVDEEDLERV